MSQFSEKNFDAQGYSSNRPTYPNSFYYLLDKYHEGPRKIAVDVGCGPGVATFQLAARLKSFDKIVGTDVSSTMVERARRSKEEELDKFSKVSFEVSPAEKFDYLPVDQINNKMIDMITAVECAHWFDFQKFQKAAASNLRKGGTLAIWGYSDAFFPEYPKIDSLTMELTYDENVGFGRYWDQPGRNLLKNMYKDLHLESDLFTNIDEQYYTENEIRPREHVNNEPVPLSMSKFITLEQYQEFIKTWSAYHAWKKSNPDIKGDITDVFVNRAMECYPELNKSSKIQVCWRTFYKFAKAL